MIFITITSKINMEIKQNYHSDTDSLCYEIESNDVYQDFWNNKNKFDNSDYPENSQFYDKSNKKVIGKFKDEASGIPITEFIGLRSKMYSYIKDNDQNNKTAKGIKKIVIKKNIKHDKYKGVLLTNKQIYHTMKTIQRDVYKTWTPGPRTTPVDHPSFCKITTTKIFRQKREVRSGDLHTYMDNLSNCL